MPIGTLTRRFHLERLGTGVIVRPESIVLSSKVNFIPDEFYLLSLHYRNHPASRRLQKTINYFRRRADVIQIHEVNKARHYKANAVQITVRSKLLGLCKHSIQSLAAEVKVADRATIAP